MPEQEKRGGKATGYWYGVWDRRAHGEGRKRVRFDTRAAAVGWEAYVKATGTLPPWGPQEGAISGNTFASVAAECKAAGGKQGAWKSGRDDSVLQRTEYLCGTKLGPLPIEGVTYERLVEVVADLEKRPGKKPGTRMAAGTINRYLTAASAVLSFALSKGLIKAKPEIPWRKEPRQARFWWLTEAQERGVCAALLAAGHPVTEACVRFLTRTGLRMGEFLSLEPAQIEDTWVRLWKTKTDTPRSVPIEPELAREMRALVASKALPNYNALYDQFREACNACGYDPHLSPHCLRHTTATRLVQKNVELAKVQKFMGHRNIQTTMRYVHVQDDDLAEAAKNLYPQRGETSPNTSIRRLRA